MSLVENFDDISKIEIKEVTSSDAKFLYLLMNDSSILKKLNEVPTTLDDWKEAVEVWRDDLDEENYLVWLNNNRAGWFSLNNLQATDRIVFLKMAALLPEYQHHGIGTIILQKLLKSVKDRGYNSVMLYTNANNIDAQKCYQKCGFTVVEEFADVMSDNNRVNRYKMSCNF